MSSHAQAKGTTRAVAVARASTGLTTTGRPAQGCEPGARARETRPLVVTGKPVREPHDSTGEPGAGNRPAGFGERGEETYPRDSACGPVAKAPDKPPTPYRLRASPRLYSTVASGPGSRGGRTARPPPARATRPRGIDAWLDARRGGNDLGRICGQTADGARTRRGPGGLLRGFLSALGPRGCHPLGNRLLLFGRHRSALPRRLGVGRGLRYRGGRSRRPPRGGAPSRGLRRSGGPEHLVDVVQRLDLPLQALDLTLAVGDFLCYDTHKFSQGLYRPSLDALWAPARARSNGFRF